MENDLSLYYSKRHLIQSADLLQWSGIGPIQYTIQFISGGIENHSGFALKPPEHGIWKDRRLTLEAQAGGIKLRLLSELLRDYRGRVWLYPLNKKFDALRPQIESWAMSKEGVKYDFGSLFKNILGRVNTDARSLFCSEYYYLGCREAGIEMDWPYDKAPRPADMPRLGIHDKPILLLDSR